MSDFSDFSDNDSDFSGSSEDDVDMLAQLGNIITRNENFLDETVPSYDGNTFFEHFRVSRELAVQIGDSYGLSEYYNEQSGHFGKIPARNQVLIFLWFMGHQTASFNDVSDRFAVCPASLHRIIRRVSLFLSNLSPQLITWPNQNEKEEIEVHFREKGFPNIIGAIDGSHIQIDKPQHDPDSYINRKGYYSVQMQVVCDHKKKSDIFVGYPGSVHDSRVFRNSILFNTLEDKCGEYFLLGDSGYPLRRNLLTPFKDRGALNNRQINYNIRLARNRYVIEHCFGLLKQKFRQLYHLKLRNMVYIVHFIRAACVLHNMAIDEDLELINENIEVNIDIPYRDGGEEEIPDDRDARRIRDFVVNSLPI